MYALATIALSALLLGAGAKGPKPSTKAPSASKSKAAQPAAEAKPAEAAPAEAKPADASGGDPILAQAKAHVEQAKKAFAAKKFGIAVQEFEAAQKLKPAPVLWFNIGKCYDKLNDPSKALRAFSSYLREAPDTKDKKEVLASIARMEVKLKAKGLHQLTVTAEPNGAMALVAGKGSQTVPATFDLKPGKYTVTIMLDGYQSVRKDVDVSAKGSAQLDVKLQVAAVAAATPAPPPVAAATPPPAVVEAPKPARVEPKPPPPSTVVATAKPPTDRPVAPPPPTSPSVSSPLEPTDMGPLVEAKRRQQARGFGRQAEEPGIGKPLTLIAGGASVVGLGVGIGLGLTASSAAATLTDGSIRSQTEVNDLFGRATTSAMGANIGYGAAAVAAVTAAILFFVEQPPSAQ